MENIDWNFTSDKKTEWTGEYDGNVCFNREAGHYEIRFNNGSPEIIKNCNGLSFGLKDGEVYVTTKKIEKAPYFQVRTHKSGYRIIRRKKLILDIIQSVLEKVPNDKISIQFNLKHCSENIYRIVDPKII